jgi:protein-disulfide isomerase
MNKSTSLLSSALLLASLMSLPAFAASTKDEVIALKEEVQELRSGQDAIQNELAEIKKMIASGNQPSAPKQPEFEPREISIAGAPFKGNADAQVTLIEYSDYQCPYCKRHLLSVWPQIKEQYLDTGKLKFVMREFPLTSIHPRAVAASMAALCAKNQGKYWDMHDILFENQRALSDDDIKSYSETIGLDVDAFVACMDSAETRPQVQKDLEEGQSMGIRGTPSFALGLTKPDDTDTVTVSTLVRGARGFDAFAEQIDALLNDSEEAETASP